MTARPALHALEALLDAAVDAIVIIDDGGRIEVFNPAAERMFGWPAEEAVGANVSLLMPEPHRSRHDAYIRRYLDTGEAHVIGIGREVEACRRDGSRFPAWISIARIGADRPARFVGFVQDVSRRHEAERNERLAARRAAEFDRLSAMADIAGDIAHEVNQPLTAIANYARACEKLLAKSPADLGPVREALQQIAGQALRAGDSIRRLRAVIRDGDGGGAAGGKPKS